LHRKRNLCSSCGILIMLNVRVGSVIFSCAQLVPLLIPTQLSQVRRVRLTFSISFSSISFSDDDVV